METITTFPGYIVQISEKCDGDMRDPSLHSEIIRPIHQVHGADISEFQMNTKTKLDDVDGIYTREYQRKIGAICADCPIIICMGKGECAAIHSGWKGTKKHIIKNALLLFSTPIDQIQIFMGPHMRKDSYQVQPDFFEHFPNRYFHIQDGGSFFDIASFLIDDMLEVGIHKNHIHTHGADTYRDTNFYSYRRDGMIGVGCVSVEMLL